MYSFIHLLTDQQMRKEGRADGQSNAQSSLRALKGACDDGWRAISSLSNWLCQNQDFLSKILFLSVCMRERKTEGRGINYRYIHMYYNVEERRKDRKRSLHYHLFFYILRRVVYRKSMNNGSCLYMQTNCYLNLLLQEQEEMVSSSWGMKFSNFIHTYLGDLDKYATN